MSIENTPAVCPICYKLRANDYEVEECIKNHKGGVKNGKEKSKKERR